MNRGRGCFARARYPEMFDRRDDDGVSAGRRADPNATTNWEEQQVRRGSVEEAGKYLQSEIKRRIKERTCRYDLAAGGSPNNSIAATSTYV